MLALWLTAQLVLSAVPGLPPASQPAADFPMSAEQAQAVQRRSAEACGLPLVVTNSVGMRLVYIPPGRFRMGSPPDEEGRDDDEGPAHWVTITRPFYLGACEVTQGQYRAVMGDNPAWFQRGDDYPVERVEWFDAVHFCQVLSAREGRPYRLPTEAEWEYACRAGSETPFAVGRRISTDQANFDGSLPYAGLATGVYRRRPMPVGSLAPNAWGLYDMHGNLWEWCHDWYDKRYYERSPADDPRGEPAGSARVIRGGAWNRFARGIRSADRGHAWPGKRLLTLGFRVVGEVPDEAR